MKIYHNPRCTTSCKTLELIKSRGLKPEVVEYLKNPPSAQEIREIVKMLGISPFELVRQKEKIFIEKFKDKNYINDEWVEILAANPKLMQRPVIISGNKAVIGRPPENVLTLI